MISHFSKILITIYHFISGKKTTQRNFLWHTLIEKDKPVYPNLQGELEVGKHIWQPYYTYMANTVNCLHLHRLREQGYFTLWSSQRKFYCAIFPQTRARYVWDSEVKFHPHCKNGC